MYKKSIAMRYYCDNLVPVNRRVLVPFNVRNCNSETKDLVSLKHIWMKVYRVSKNNSRKQNVMHICICWGVSAKHHGQKSVDSQETSRKSDKT